MAGRLSSLLQPRPERRLLLIVLFLLLMAAAAIVLVRMQTPAQQEEAAAGGVGAEFATYLAAIEREPNLIDGYRSLSLAYQAAGRIEDAAAVWERAAQANPGQVWPLLELGRTYEAAGLLIQGREAFYQAASLNPQDTAANQALARLAEAAAGQQAIKSFLAARLPGNDPDLLVRELAMMQQPLANGWTFLGYHGDLAGLAEGRQARLWTFWQAPALEIAPSLAAEEWEQVAPGIWGRQVLSSNLVQNGNFEGALAGSGLDGFPIDVFYADPITRQVRRLARDDEFTSVAMLANDSANRNSSLAAPYQPIAPDSILLAAVDSYHEGGNPGMVLSWSNAGEELAGGAQAARAAGRWQTQRMAAAPPPAAGGVQMQLVNTESSSAAYFDNAVLAAFPAPAPLWPAVAAPAEAAVAPEVAAEEERRARFQTQINGYFAYPAIVHDPEWQAALAAIGPIEPIDQTLSSGWTLLGYSTDESSLVRGEPTPLVLYWQGPAGALAGTAAEGWIALPRDRWLQFLPSATNSLADGTFEAGLGGWPGNIFPAPAASRQIAISERDGYTSTVGVLTNTLAFTSTSFLPAWQPVAPNQLFLQSGWMRSDNARGWIGYQWAGDIDPAYMPFNRYVIAAGEENIWRHFAGIAEPLPGAQQVQVHLLNYPSSGVAYFDDILFTPIPAPQSNAGSTQQSRGGAQLAEYAANPAVVEDERWLADVAAVGPAHLLDQNVANGWSFVGYSADEAALAAGAVAPVFYFWQGPLGETPGSAQDGWYSIDAGLWLQIKRTGNLLAGEQQLALPETPASDAVAIDDRLLYLQTARARSLNGAAFQAGITWQGSAFASPGEATQFVAMNLDDEEWVQVAGLLAAPAGASVAQLVLAGEGAIAEAGELLLLPVAPPAPLAPR